ncbi:hypothetical protein KJ662_03910, partial [Patescibacteria group bacterium]|nr:hypothetical protein [Patescibacteria group bacterium]MBU1938228.1 hypothetical protein [Patescibacteria group bacterium]
NGKTPLEKLKESGILQPEQILRFPVIILDDLFSVLKSGNYLCNHYHFSFLAYICLRCQIGISKIPILIE